MKSKTTAYLLWAAGIFGICGLHRFYLGKIGTGILWLLTLGLLGVGQLIDLFTLSGQVDRINGTLGYGPGHQNQQNVNQDVNVNVQVPESNADERIEDPNNSQHQSSDNKEDDTAKSDQSSNEDGVKKEKA